MHKEVVIRAKGREILPSPFLDSSFWKSLQYPTYSNQEENVSSSLAIEENTSVENEKVLEIPTTSASQVHNTPTLNECPTLKNIYSKRMEKEISTKMDWGANRSNQGLKCQGDH